MAKEKASHYVVKLRRAFPENNPIVAAGEATVSAKLLKRIQDEAKDLLIEEPKAA